MKHTNLVAAILAVVTAIMTTSLSAAEPTKVTLRYLDRLETMEMMPGSSPAGRMIYSALIRGTSKETRGTGLFDASERVVRANWDLTHGSGLGSGTNIVSKGGDTITVQWSGACTTLMGKDSKPLIHCGGGWVFVPGSGTGRYAGVIGGGSWWGAPNAQGALEGEAEGYFQN